MKRFFLIVVISLLTFSLVRALNGGEPLTLSGFLDALSELDFSFKYTKGVVEYMKNLSFDLTIDGVEELFNPYCKFFQGYIFAACYSLFCNNGYRRVAFFNSECSYEMPWF